MAELLTVKLTSPQIRCAVRTLGALLGDPLDTIAFDAVGQDEAVLTFLALSRALTHTAGWRPGGVDLSPWAVEALARVTAPPPAAKPAKARAKHAAAAPRRRRRDPRRRHDQPARRAADLEPPLPMGDDLTGDAFQDALQ